MRKIVIIIALLPLFVSAININEIILIQLIPVIITSALFTLVQIIAFLLAYRKVLKVRPIIALKKVGE